MHRRYRNHRGAPWEISTKALSCRQQAHVVHPGPLSSLKAIHRRLKMVRPISTPEDGHEVVVTILAGEIMQLSVAS